MAKRVRPLLPIRKVKSSKLKKLAMSSTLLSGPTFNRLTLLWVNNNGVPFNTTGFNAALYRGNSLVQTARFDRFGTVFFSSIQTPTIVSYTIVVYNNNGLIYRRRTIPAGVQAFAIPPALQVDAGPARGNTRGDRRAVPSQEPSARTAG